MTRAQDERVAGAIGLEDRDWFLDGPVAGAWATVDRIRERNADLNLEEELAFIADVVDDVRRERDGARQQSRTAGRR